MPVNISDVNEFTSIVQAPDDGDDADGATFQLSPQALANRTHFLNQRRITMNVQQLQGKRLYFPVPVVDNSVNEWGMQSNFSTGARWLVQGTPVGNPYFWFPLPGLPATWRLNAIDLYLKGASQHVVSGGHQPAVRLHRIGADQNPVLTGSEATDDTNVAGYATPHKITISSLGNHEIQEEAQYFLRVRGEGDSGVSGLQVWGARVLLIVPSTWS